MTTQPTIDACAGQGWHSSVKDGTATLLLAGDWQLRDTTADIAATTTLLDGTLLDATLLHATLLDGTPLKSLVFDTARLGQWDSTLLVFLKALRESAARNRIAFDPAGLPPSAQRLLAMLPDRPPPPAHPAERPSFVEAVGLWVLGHGAKIGSVITLVGELVLRSGAALGGRARMRGTDLMTCIVDAGIGALC